MASVANTTKTDARMFQRLIKSSQMASDDQHDGDEQNTNGTPSTASRVNGAPVESAFTTPTPRRDMSKDSVTGRNPLSLPIPFNFVPKSSPAPRQHKSVEVLGTNARNKSSALSAASDLERQQHLHKEVSKKNSQHFDQAFAVREPYHSSKARVHRDSMIVLELHLNCCIEEQQGFLNDFLQVASETYHRPVNTITIIINTNSQIMMCGSTEPAYLLNITALPTEIAATKNMRSASLIQDFIAQSLEISKDRGVIKFLSINDQDLATNGITIIQEIEKLERECGEEKRGLSLRSRQSNRPSRRSQLPTTSEATGEIEHSRSDTPILITGNDGCDDPKAFTHIQSSSGRIKARRSIMSFFKR